MLRHNINPIIKHMEHKLHMKLDLFVVWSGQECFQEMGFFNPDKPDVPAMFKRLNTLYFHSDYIGSVRPTNCLLIDDSPYKGCLNYLNTGIYPRTFNVSEVDDFLNGTLWPYLEDIRGENIMDYVEEHPFGQPQITLEHRDFNRFAPLIKQVGSMFWKKEGLPGGASFNEECTSKLRKCVRKVSRKVSRKATPLSRGEIMVYSELFGMGKHIFSENEGRKFVKRIFK